MPEKTGGEKYYTNISKHPIRPLMQWGHYLKNGYWKHCPLQLPRLFCIFGMCFN